MLVNEATFTKTAEGLGYTNRSASSAWHNLLVRVMGENSSQGIRLDQLGDVVSRGRDAVPQLSDSQWTLLTDVAKELA